MSLIVYLIGYFIIEYTLQYSTGLTDIVAFSWELEQEMQHFIVLSKDFVSLESLEQGFEFLYFFSHRTPWIGRL